MRQFSCPACGETKQLSGARSAEGIRISCGACGASWMRDQTPRCATCGGTEVFSAPRVVLSMGRGSITSMAGQRDVLVCYRCDREAILTYHDRGSPLPPNYVPAAHTPRA
ncbi:hypothetical protein [Georgenia daeguensis]|uniref:Transcription factor zinc-finger domain-containing protein n=1 Tax=Georgenia daeguensis TaxID=908355 RepID=A0ABP8EYJ5_9MICO